MEQAAKAHNVACVISGDVAETIDDDANRLSLIGHEKIRGQLTEVPIYEFDQGRFINRRNGVALERPLNGAPD